MRPFLRSSAFVLAFAAAACGGSGSPSDGGASDAATDGSPPPHDASTDGHAATDAHMAFPDGATGGDLGTRDAGGATDAAATDGAAAMCGSVVCGDGMRCCSEACSLCGPLGALCPAIACYDAGPAPDGGAGIPACRAMEATGTGTCDHLLGYAYDGLACRALRGCSCTGPGCGGLYTSLASCAASIAPCATP